MKSPQLLVRPATEAERRATLDGLNAHYFEYGGLPEEKKPFAILAYEEDKLIGSFIGEFFFNWLYLNLLWVHPQQRGTGLGSRLIREAESHARLQKMSGIYCWTQDFQAPEFYRKMGFEPFGELKDFPPGHTRLGFRKYLT